MATNSDKIDLYKQHKDEYGAGKKPRIVQVQSASYLAIEGVGAPGGEQFEAGVGALYAAAYTVKMTSKTAGRDYVVCKLEAVWWTDDGQDMATTPQDQWCWKLMIRAPDFIKKKDLRTAVQKIEAKGSAPGIGKVTLETMSEGTCVQSLHVGPYDAEPETVAQMVAFAAAQGLQLRGRHHEVYLSDPRRVEPARLKTILRHPVT